MRITRVLFLSFLTLVMVAGFICLDRNCAYAGDPLTKLGRGLANLGTGLLEVPKEIQKQEDEYGDIAGFFVGPIKGFAKGLGRMGVGLFEVVTFIIPLPKNYDPVIYPEYVYQADDPK